MIGGRRLPLAAAVMALCVGCSSSSSGGDVVCGPCRPPVMVTVSGLDRLTVEGVRMQVCVGGQPCADFRVTRLPGMNSSSCGSVACSLLETGALQVTLPQRTARTVADQPVRVTASSRQGQREGAATMTFVAEKGPCGCDYSYADVVLG
ncbi:hypothetical protein E1264_34635 [Actinomadura sp. KC216]|uniref:hypothetical protein n=1 Tax=Actinomadura sp. KC216 TaxID=2530370 RepID=UPI00104E9F16|nr:hypothetical protein [Actinomadura sp. KC216]TDB80071.1 hypothetical protein E1264_34635 [Actinomadura sp. KC216]